jgi:hypothetical protein
MFHFLIPPSSPPLHFSLSKKQKAKTKAKNKNKSKNETYTALVCNLTPPLWIDYLLSRKMIQRVERTKPLHI